MSCPFIRPGLATTFCLAFCAIGAGAAAEEIKLAPRFAPGDERYVEISSRVEIRTESPRGPQETKVNRIVGWLVRTDRADRDGGQLSITFDRMLSEVTLAWVGDEPLKFDSDSPGEDATPMLKELLGALIGASRTIEIDASGKAVKADGGEALAARLASAASENNFFLPSVRDSVSDERTRRTFNQGFVGYLPAKPVSVGDEWEAKIERDLAQPSGVVTFTCRCKLEKLEKKDGRQIAIISYRSASHAPAEGDEKPEGAIEEVSLSGTLRFDVAAGLPLDQQEEFKSKGSVERDGPQGKVTLTTTASIGETTTWSTAAERRKDKQEALARAEASRKAAEEEAVRRKAAIIASLEKADRPTGPVDRDWTQFMGPRQDSRINSARLADEWPASGPKKLWSRELGDGYSCIVSDGERLYTMYSVPRDATEEELNAAEGEKKEEGGDAKKEGDDAASAKKKQVRQDVVTALDPKTGRTLWEYRYDAPFTDKMLTDFGEGPRSTPLIVGDRLYTVSALVQLHCLAKDSGSVLWSHDLRKEYDASPMGRGYGASPFAFGDMIILPMNGENQAVIAFDQKTGDVVWKNQSFGPSYATPFVMKVHGEDHLVIFADKGVNGLDPKDGRLLWSAEHADGANISTPVWGDDNTLFVSSAYGIGSRGFRVNKLEDGTFKAEEMWYNRKMKIHHGNAIRIGDVVYGSSGDFGPAFFAAVDMKSGDFLWRERGLSKATAVYADSKMIILDEDGNLMLALVSPVGMQIVSRAGILKKVSWTMPTLVGTTLYVRDLHTIAAYELG